MMLYQPKEGTVLFCDFDGFIAPEIVKKRPVIVIKKHSTNSKLVTVVPLSLTPPQQIMPYHYEFISSPSPIARVGDVAWAKCDMVVTVSIDRLDRFKIKTNGVRTYAEGRITPDELGLIKECVAIALGINDKIEVKITTVDIQTNL